MINVRAANSRGLTRADWLESRHSFSFGDYHDAAHMGFGPLRVINDDVVNGGAGFAPHSHANMEILSFVVAGALAHRDSAGGGATLNAGDVQWMSAGYGIRHSEFNASAEAPVRFVQVWIQPDVLNAPPTYSDQSFPHELRVDRWCLVAAKGGADGALPIRQDVRVHVADLGSDITLDYALASGRRAWVQVVNGELELNGVPLASGDGAAATDERALHLRASSAASVLLFDLA